MNTKRHLAFIHKEFPYGGAEKVTFDTANHLCDKGYVVTILTAKHNKHLYPQKSEKRFKIEMLPKRQIKSSMKVARYLRDYILTHNVCALITSRELLYAKWLKKQTAVKLVFHLHSSPFYEFLDVEEKKSQNRWTKMVYDCGLQWLLIQFYQQKYLRVYKWADAYGVLCKAYSQVLIDRLKLSSENKLWILPNSIGTTGPIVHTKQKVIVYVGRLSHRDKRVDRLLRIWKLAQPRIPEWTLKIVGDGREMSNLQILSSEFHLKNISFEGQTNNVKRYYDEAAILCLTSSFEGWPMSVAEAQSNGVVPIVFDSFLGAEEMISTQEEGVLVLPFDESLYADAIVQLASEPDRLDRMRENVISKAKEYSIDKTGIAWIEMLNHLLE